MIKGRRVRIIDLWCLQVTASSIGTGTAADAALIDDVPGCKCEASLCGSSLYDYSGIDACHFTKQSEPPYVFEDVVNSTEPICDALLADPTFRETYGGDAVPEFGYDPTGFLPIHVTTGTCEEAYSTQNLCKTIPWGRVATNTTEVDGPRSFGAGVSVGLGSSRKSCSAFTLELPTTSRYLRITRACRSNFDESITIGHDDSMLVYVELESNNLHEEESFCSSSRREELSKRSPVLTSEDWIEPQSRRRYMCYDFIDDNQAYNVLLLSLGNEPCSGPFPDPTYAPSDSFTETFSPGRSAGTRNQNVAVAISSVALVVSLPALLRPIWIW